MPTQVHGKRYVATEGADILAVRPAASNYITVTSGERVQMRRHYTTSAIATGASDTSVIAAPADANKRIVVFAYTIMCDAATSVTFRCNSTSVGMIHYCAANGGIVRPYNGQPLIVCDAQQALAINTSGGNTSLDIHFAEVPVDVDFI